MRAGRLIALGAAAVLAVSGLTALTTIVRPAPAGAIEGPMPSNVAPTWQTNAPVTALLAVGGVLYVGGEFTSVRLPGRPVGSGEIVRHYLAAFEAGTGRLIVGFNHPLDAPVHSLAASPDGQTIYVGGDFASIDGVARSRVAAFSAATGAVTSFDPGANARVTGISAATTAVYLSGSFSVVGGAARQRLAAVNPSTGAALPTFTSNADNVVYQTALSGDGSKLYLAGAFTSLNGDAGQHAAAVVDSTTGTALPFPAGSIIPPKSPSCTVEAKTVKTDGSGAYFGVEGSGLGCFDGTFAVNGADGSLRWQSKCLGATQAVQPVGTILYTGSHSHDCSGDRPADPDAFPEVGAAKGLSRHLLSRSTSTGHLSTWYPNTDGGPNKTGLGPRVMATDGSRLFVGGEFTTVNGLPQQGLARFDPATGDLASPSRPAPPTAVARAGGKVTISVQTPLDTDDLNLTVRLYRDGGSVPIATAAVPVAVLEAAGAHLLRRSVGDRQQTQLHRRREGDQRPAGRAALAAQPDHHRDPDGARLRGRSGRRQPGAVLAARRSRRPTDGGQLEHQEPGRLDPRWRRHCLGRAGRGRRQQRGDGGRHLRLHLGHPRPVVAGHLLDRGLVQDHQHPRRPDHRLRQPAGWPDPQRHAGGQQAVRQAPLPDQ